MQPQDLVSPRKTFCKKGSVHLPQSHLQRHFLPRRSQMIKLPKRLPMMFFMAGMALVHSTLCLKGECPGVNRVLAQDYE